MKNESLKLIGTGAFTKAYRDQKNKNRVILHSVCPIKEAFSEGYVSDHRMFPKIEKIDSIDSVKHGYMNVYEMPYYKKNNSIKNNLTARQYRLYRALREVYAKNYKFGNFGNGIYDAFREMPSEFRLEKEALIETLDQIRNFTDFPFFEISPRNIATKGKKLILLDVFFCCKKLKQVIG